MKIMNSPFFNKSIIAVILCLVFCLFSETEVKAQQTEIEKLISEVSVDTQKGAIFNYTYLMKFIYQKHKFGGRKISRIYEAILPSRYSLSRFFGHPLVLLQDSETMITDDQIRSDRLEIAERLEKMESEKEETSTIPGKPPEDGGYWTVGFSNNNQRVEINVLKLLKNVSFSNLQRMEINGRSLVLIDFAPNPNAVLEKPLAYFTKLEGQLRIDEADKRIIAIEGYAVGDLAKFKEKTDEERKKNAVFIFEQTKVAEGFWFPQTVRLNFDKHSEIFDPIELEYAFSNYNKARVDVQYQEPQTPKTETKPTGEQ
ncbi:hypothetical protein BH10ACI1_BH10ACI1_02290 [soil metagenome]